MANEQMANDKVYLAALAGLLHDVGQFGQRAGKSGEHTEIGAGWIRGIQEMFPRAIWEDLAGAVAEHHSQSPRRRVVKVVRLADWLAASERDTGTAPCTEPSTTPLVPILARLELTGASPEEPWGFGLNTLNLDSPFPQRGLGAVDTSHYADLWAQFEDEINTLKTAGATTGEQHFTSLLSLLHKYLTFVPSATLGEESAGAEERTLPNVSLYDHLKVTAAIAACLERGLSDDQLDLLLRRDEAVWQQPVAVMARGDLSGIQGFIYRITRPAGDATFRGVAKRLRGRSFYLALLGDAAGDWLIRRLGLPSANLLFCGGGRFDLLIPVDGHSQQELAECLKELECWLFDTFNGELGIQFATQEVTPSDFGNLRRVYAGLEYQLIQNKTRKWQGQMDRVDFYVSGKNEYHACPVCHLTSMDEPRICPMCKQQHEIGGKLPDTSWIAFAYDKPETPQGAVSVSFECFDSTVLLMNPSEAETFLYRQRQRPSPAMLYRLNSTDFVPDEVPTALGLGFRFLANTAPVALEAVQLHAHEPANPGDVLDFEEIAELSTGAKRLGVLKADVDHLGLLFSDGVESPTISRQAALSHTMDLFFSGWLNRLCDNVFAAWKDGPGKDHPWRDRITNLFYVLYSGGDDLFVVGPWDQIIELASQLQADFTGYACHNPNVTLSASVVQVKPHYPVQRFAQLVSDRLGEAKDAGRNRINIFSHPVVWHDEQVGRGYDWNLRFAKDLCHKIEDRDVPRTLIHDIGRLYRRHRVDRNGHLKPMWVPELYYTLARRLRKEVRETVQDDIFNAIAAQTILVPVTYVSLITRKE